MAQSKARRPAKRRAALCAILVGGAGPTPATRDCLHPFERRLRLRDPELATANSSWELTVGTHFVRKHVRKDVAPRFIGAALPARRGLGGVGRENTDYLVAARQEPAPLEKPQGRLPWTPMSARPFVVGGGLAVPSVYIGAELGRVGAPPVRALAEGRHEAHKR